MPFISLFNGLKKGYFQLTAKYFKNNFPSLMPVRVGCPEVPMTVSLVQMLQITMKKTIALLALLSFTLTYCGQKKAEEDPNKILYNEVMDIHDEVMPSMEELYRLKKGLEEKVKNSPDLVENKKQEMESTILLIDSASKSMMVWMREFNPEEYEKEAQRDYLEKELKRVKTVKDVMLKALDEGRKATQDQ